MSVQGDVLYHLAPVEDLREARSKGQAYTPRTYQQDGFTHLTADPALLMTVANTFYRDSASTWVVMCLAVSKLKSKVLYEPAAPVGSKPATGLQGGEQARMFPHLYGPIDLDAIESELPVRREADGTFVGVDGL